VWAELSPAKTYEFVAAGELGYVRLGRAIRFPRDELDRCGRRLRRARLRR
jgi:excisionase family DNA binding protein